MYNYIKRKFLASKTDAEMRKYGEDGEWIGKTEKINAQYYFCDFFCHDYILFDFGTGFYSAQRIGTPDLRGDAKTAMGSCASGWDERACYPTAEI